MRFHRPTKKALTIGLSAALGSAIAFLVLFELVFGPFVRSYTIQLPATVIDRVTVYNHKEDTTATITDSDQIERITAFVKTRRSSWERIWYTPASPNYSLSFESNGKTQYSIGVGTNWIDFKENGPSSVGNLTKNISPAERFELLDDFGK